MNKPRILGNPEEQKGIEKLLEQAGKDKLINGVIKGKKEEPEQTKKKPKPKSFRDYSIRQPMIAVYGKGQSPKHKLPDGGILVGYYAGFSVGGELIEMGQRIDEWKVQEHSYSGPTETKRLFLKETYNDFDSLSVLDLEDKIVEVHLKDGDKKMIGFFSKGLTQGAFILWEYMKGDRLYDKQGMPPILDIEDIDLLSIFEPEK